MMDRRACIVALTGCIVGFPLIADAQVAGKTYRICGLNNTPPSDPVSVRLSQAFLQALGERGFVEGRNFVFERRFVEGHVERIPALAAELVRLNCDVIMVTAGDVAVRTLKELTSTIPIVMVGASDPVRDGLVASLARPGANITGLTDASLDLIPKQLELLKTAAPGVRRVVYLYGRYGAFNEKTNDELMRNREVAAKGLGLDLIRIEMPAPQDFANATAAVLRERADALLISPNNTNFILRNEISEFALRHRLPAIGPNRELAAAGLLLSYGNNVAWRFRKSAEYVDKILRGAKPADLPIEQSTFELVINLTTAKALGLTIPQSVLLRADEVIQ